MSGKGKCAFAAGVFLLLVVLNSSWAARVYEYEVTVGTGPGYDFSEINDAIKDVIDNRTSGMLACIWVYPGEYEEQLHDTYTLTAPPPPRGAQLQFSLESTELPSAMR